MKQYPGLRVALALILGQFVSPLLFAQQASDGYLNPYYRTSLSGAVAPTSAKWRASGWRFPAWEGQLESQAADRVPGDVYAIGYVRSPTQPARTLSPVDSRSSVPAEPGLSGGGNQFRVPYASAAQTGQWHFHGDSVRPGTRSQPNPERYSYSERAGTRYQFRNSNSLGDRSWVNRGHWGQSVWNDQSANNTAPVAAQQMYGGTFWATR